MNNLCKRLFAGEVIWGLHTTYNCDIAYSAEVLMKQYKENALGNVWNKNGFAVFYNKACGIASSSSVTDAKWFKDKFFYPLENNKNQTFHAKISLIKYKDNIGNDGYRIAIYSKNQTFGYNCAEIGQVYELVKKKSGASYINELCDYLDMLFDSTSEKGREWLSSKGLNKNGELYSILSDYVLQDDKGNNVQLLFGGCDSNKASLGKRIDFADIEPANSIILTPPEFIRNSEGAKLYFEKNKLLYDIKQDSAMEKKQSGLALSSHEKLYLLKKQDGTYHLWFGSANATPHGLGINFDNSFSEIEVEKCSVECLIHQELNREVFEHMFHEVNEYYDIFYDFNNKGSLKSNKDTFSAILSTYCTAAISYLDSNNDEIVQADYLESVKKLKVVLSANGNSHKFDSLISSTDLFSITPTEYFGKKISGNILKVGDTCLELKQGNTVELLIEISEYQKIKGTAYINGNTLMDLEIPESLKQEVEINPPMYSITLVSNWLLRDKIPAENYNDSKLQWFRDLFINEKSSKIVSVDSKIMKKELSGLTQSSCQQINIESNTDLITERMGFQKRGTEALLNILEHSSRVFLADEAGLGKTYTSTGVMDALYEKYMSDSNNLNKPFYVFYVAPNIPLLSKNCQDIVKKSKYKESIVDLSNLEFDKLAKISIDYVLKLKKICPKRREDIANKVYFLIHERMKNGAKWNDYSSRRGLEEIYKDLGVDKKEISRKLFCDIILSQKISNVFGAKNNIKSVDRIVFIKEYLESAFNIFSNNVEPKANIFNGKIVLLPISAQLILDSDELSESGRELEKKLRKGKTRREVTLYFLDKYTPNMIIWDEYHRYMKKMDDIINPFMNWEKRCEKRFMALYLSATPYLTNKNEIDIYTEKKFDEWNDDKSKEKLPSFEEFAELLVGGYSEDVLSKSSVMSAYNLFMESNQKDELERILKSRMVRHERTKLQNSYEQHDLLFESEKYGKDYESVFVNTKKRIKEMKNAGFKEGTCEQAMNMPFLMAFMYRNQHYKDRYTVIEDVEKSKVSSNLFLPDKLDSLPNESIAFKQLYETNIKNEQASLIWIPPVNTLYEVGDNSIFSRYKKYSKTLIFAETLFYQRGYSYLLSRYVDEVANCHKEIMLPNLNYAERVEELEQIVDLWKLTEKNLDQIILRIRQTFNSYSYEEILASIASPAVCAKRLGLNPQNIEEYFNKYFHRPGIKNALCHWIEKWKKDNDKLVESLRGEDINKIALLRYCAEGNLLAVMEEWIFVLDEFESDKICSVFENVLVNNKERNTLVYPISESQFKKNQDADESLKKECTFAERLVGDYLDCGSGENVDVKKNLSARFSSPFWPMIMVAGRGAQEGLDYHQYCLRMMHLTLPSGPVSFEQRQGRIDRFRCLLVRRRVGKYFEANNTNYIDCKKELLKRQYGYLLQNKPKDNELYANYNMPDDGENYFERLMPFWDYTNEARECHILENKMDSYRSSLGTYKDLGNAIDLSADLDEDSGNGKV